MEEPDYRNAKFLVDAAEYQLHQQMKSNAAPDQLKPYREALAKAKKHLDDVISRSTSGERQAFSVSLAESKKKSTARERLNPRPSRNSLADFPIKVHLVDSGAGWE